MHTAEAAQEAKNHPAVKRQVSHTVLSFSYCKIHLYKAAAAAKCAQVLCWPRPKLVRRSLLLPESRIQIPRLRRARPGKFSAENKFTRRRRAERAGSARSTEHVCRGLRHLEQQVRLAPGQET